MLRDLKSLIDTSIEATDGMIGSVKDLYFDDRAWVIRYFVVETGSWLSARRVLISPVSIDARPGRRGNLSATLTKAQVRDSPAIDTNQPVSQQHELSYLRYYGYACYWSGGGLWGRGAHPGSQASGLDGESTQAIRRADRDENAHLDAEADAEHRPRGDHHLRSCNTVMVYHVAATDGDVGHVAGYLIDPATWAIRYLVVNTGPWWLGHEVLLAPQWIDAVRWDDNALVVSVNRAMIRSAPAYSTMMPLRREREIDLHRHYGRSGYWADEVGLQNPEFQPLPTAVQQLFP